MPPFVNLTLVETNTEIIFDLPSQTAEKDTPEGQLVDADNKLYEHLTVGKLNYKLIIQRIFLSVYISSTYTFIKQFELCLVLSDYSLRLCRYVALFLRFTDLKNNFRIS